MSQAGEYIRQVVEREGPVTFARFMGLALYGPGGYYRRGELERDYFTSPLAHPAFGALLALQLHQMAQTLGGHCWVVEVGAGKGRLAGDLLESARRLGLSLKYVALERRPRPLPGVHPLAAAGVPLKGVVGCFLSNELLDSFPVHRIAVQGGRLLEVYVTWQEGFREVLRPPSTPLLEKYLEEQGAVLPEGYRTEINLEAGRWLGGVAGALERGFVITIDYGYAPGEYFSPARSQGTLLCYYRHTYHQDPYIRVGEQDITAHVDFGSLIRAGERSGLATLGLVPQARFLNNLGLGYLREKLARAGLSPREYLANSLALGELVRPGGLGDFLVLIQGKGCPGVELRGLKPSPGVREALDELPLPLLTPQHLALLEARYPHMLSLPDALAGGYPDS